MRALDAQRRDQHEPGGERTGQRPRRVHGVRESRRVAAVAALQQPRGDREHGAEQRAGNEEQERHGEDLAREQRTPARAGALGQRIHPIRQSREQRDLERRGGGERELQASEARERDAAAHAARDGRSTQREPEQVDAQHGGERIHRRAEHEPEQPYPRDLERERREPRQCEQERHGEPVSALEAARRDRGSGSGPQRRAPGRSPRGRPRSARRYRDRARGSGRLAARPFHGASTRPTRHRRQQRRARVQPCRHPRGAGEPDPGQQREPPGDRSRHGAERVERVQARQRRAHHPAIEVGHEHRQRRAHQSRRRNQEREQEREPSQCKRRPLAVERAVEVPHGGLESSQHGQRHHPEHGHAQLQQRVHPRPIAAPRQRHAEAARSQREPAQERRHHRGHRVQRAPEQVGELLRPGHLVQQARRARDEEAHGGPAAERCRRAGRGRRTGPRHAERWSPRGGEARISTTYVAMDAANPTNQA